jgi:hypothetical protein
MTAAGTAQRIDWMNRRAKFIEVLIIFLSREMLQK